MISKSSVIYKRGQKCFEFFPSLFCFPIGFIQIKKIHAVSIYHDIEIMYVSCQSSDCDVAYLLINDSCQLLGHFFFVIVL
jgi:hypothetical protein